MATKAIKFSNNTTTYLPVTDASLVQMKVGNETKSIKEVILENEEVTAAAYNELNDRLTNVETSYVKSIATSGTGTFINGVTIGNDSTGGKKLTFSYGTATSDVFIINVTEKSNGTYEADKTLTEVDIAMAQGKDVIYIVNYYNYYKISFHVPTQCAVAVRMNLNEPAMDSAKASYLYHTISDVTVGSLNLVDESNLKTINNTSLLGSGNIEVQAPLTQHDPVTVSVSQLKYDAGQTITLDDSFVNSALGSYITTSLTGSSSNDYWKYTTSNN